MSGRCPKASTGTSTPSSTRCAASHRFFFEVLPRLKPGVLVHVHDIFWPADYPDDWILNRGQTWNEQYVLQAFLMYNDAFETVICNSMLCQHRTQAVEELFRATPETQHSGASVWLRTTGSA